MYYFSDKFLTGLKSKSENFQNEFFYVVDRLCQDSGDDQFIQAMIEQELSYNHPGNLINYSEQIWGGEPQCRTEKEWVQKICETVHDLFEEEEWGEYHGLDIATHLFISVHLPEDVFSDAARQMVQNFTMMQRLENPPFVYVVRASENTGAGCECFVAVMK